MAIIGIISDTHDNLPNVRIATKIFNDNDVSLVIHCGDFVAPFTLSAFKDLKCPLVGVFGNCDGDIDFLLTQAENYNFAIHHPPHKLEFDSKHILISHKPIRPEQDTDILLYGHTHKSEINYDEVLVINPGEASGWLFNCPTVAILNLKTKKAEIINF